MTPSDAYRSQASFPSQRLTSVRSNERRDTGNVYTAACSSLFTGDNGKINKLIRLCMKLATRKDAYRKLENTIFKSSSKVNHLFILSRPFQLFINSSPSSSLSIIPCIFPAVTNFWQVFHKMKPVQFIFFFLVALI